MVIKKLSQRVRYLDFKDFIAVDIGNTTCEFAVFQNNKIVYKSYIKSTPMNLDDISNLGDILKYFKQGLFVISSVVKANNEKLEAYLQKEYNAEVLIINALDYKLLMKTEKRELSSIGLDIISKSEWAISEGKNPCIIVDVGTATVVQYIDENSYMNKVAITLGLSSIYKVLNSNTALLPLISPIKSSQSLGHDTVSAMEGGVYWGYIGTINSLISKAKKETGCIKVYITGGLSKLILGDLEEKPEYKGNMIFEGIKVILDNNIDKAKKNDK